MQCLWLTLADPDPATNGQFIYSQGLINSVRAAGASLMVVGLARHENPRPATDPLGIEWRLAAEQPRASWQRLLSPVPNVAQNGNVPDLMRLVDEALAERAWDAIVFDSLCSGWALGRVLRQLRRSAQRPRLVYLSHNHEATAARHIANRASGLRRILKELDYVKVLRLERRLMAAADIITAIAPDDCRRFAVGAGARPVIELAPGYAGPRLERRPIDATVPRRAILVGSLDWPPKRAAVESFLSVGAPAFARAGIELQIVGGAEASYLADLRRRFPSVDIVGRVHDVQPYMQQARLALVPDLLGAFKLKGLDYVFNRLPIFAMHMALPGMPLEEGRSVGLFDSHAALAEGVVALIDDFATLNARQVAAYDACASRFDWRQTAHKFLQSILLVTTGTDASPSATAPAAAGR